MRGYLPAAVAALVLGLGIGIAQNVMDWSSWVLFLAALVAVLVVGALASRGSPVTGGGR